VREREREVGMTTYAVLSLVNTSVLLQVPSI
jgi:hypothetical protein